MIDQFFHTLYNESWMDWSYDIGEAGLLAGDGVALKRATLAELKWVMTWMSRGERFCLEFHGACVDSGLAVAVLRRLQEWKDEEAS